MLGKAEVNGTEYQEVIGDVQCPLAKLLKVRLVVASSIHTDVVRQHVLANEAVHQQSWNINTWKPELLRKAVARMIFIMFDGASRGSPFELSSAAIWWV